MEKYKLQNKHIIIIIINPLTAKVVGAPQMILQPVFSIFSLFCTALWDLANTRPAHSLMLSSQGRQRKRWEDNIMTWTTGSLTCEQMLMHVIAQGGCTDTERESTLKLTLGRKSLDAPGNRICVSSMMVRCCTNWATSHPLFLSGSGLTLELQHWAGVNLPHTACTS